MTDIVMDKDETTIALPAIQASPNQIAKIRETIDVTDRARITTFGDGAQRNVTAFADKILAQTKNKELGETGDLLSNIILKAKGLDPAKLKDVGFFERLFSSAKSRLEKFKHRFTDVASQIETVSMELDKHKDGLRRDIALLDDLHEETKDSIIELDAYIEAGKAYVEEYKATTLTQLKAVAEAATNDGEGLMEAQAYQDALQSLDRLEKRIFYLQQARQIGIQQLPQIRIIQAGDETLIENLQAAQRLTIPAWKQKMIILLGLTHQKDALELQKTVTDATNDMMRQASEMMKTQAIEIEQQAQRGIIDMETLEQTNQDLIDTITGVLDAQKEGRRKRAEAETRMEEMTQELRTALTDASADV